MSIASLSARPSPPYDRVGVHIVTFEACSGFTHVIARWIARPPKAAFVTRLRSVRLLVQTARQLPDQSTTLWVDPSSTGNTRRRGAPEGFTSNFDRYVMLTFRGGTDTTSDPVGPPWVREMARDVTSLGSVV